MAKGDPRSGAAGGGYFPAIYQSAIAQSAGDYDSIMDQYKQAGSNIKSGTKLNYSPVAPQFAEYQPGSNYDEIRNIAETGGLSEGEKGDLRARAVSPIKSIYDSANKNLLRQKSLSGGYSPNLAAGQSKMARESAGIIGDKATAANAAIAEMVQRGKISGATTLSGLQAGDNTRLQGVNNLNANIANQANQFNTGHEMDVAGFNENVDNNDFSQILETIKGQQSAYGTTPGIASTFGNQVLGAANQVGNFPPIQAGAMGSGGVRGNIRNSSGNSWARSSARVPRYA